MAYYYYKQGHVCGFSYSHHLPIEGSSLTDFPHQHETICKSAETLTLTRGGSESSLSPPNSEESNTTIHQLPQTEATNLSRFVQHTGTATGAHYTMSRISCLPPQVSTSSPKGLRQITLECRWLFIYVLTSLHTSLYPKSFQKGFIKGNSHWHSSHTELLFPFPASLIDPHRGWGRKLGLLPDNYVPLLSLQAHQKFFCCCLSETCFWKDSLGVICRYLYQPLATIFLDFLSFPTFMVSPESALRMRKEGRGHNNTSWHLASLLRKFQSTYQGKCPPFLS